MSVYLPVGDNDYANAKLNAFLNKLVDNGALTSNKQTMSLLGDSITYACFNSSASFVSDAGGYWTWAQILMGHRFQLLSYASVGGNRTDQIIASSLAATLAATPGYVVVEAGVNDCAQVDGALKDINGTVISAASIQMYLNQMYTQLLANGSNVIATTINPSTSINLTLRKQTLHDVNQWIRNKARTTPGMLLCDWHAAMANPTTGDPVASLVLDAVHPNALGAFAMGLKLAQTLIPVSVPAELFPFNNADPRRLMANPAMVGNNGSGLATGAVTLTTAVAAAITATTQKIARTDGVQGEWQQVLCSAGADGWSLNQPQNTNVGTDYAVGDLVFGVAEIEIESGGTYASRVGAAPINLNMNFVGSGSNSAIDNRSQSSYGLFAGPYPTGRLALRTITMPVPAGTTGINLQVQSNILGAAVRVGRMEVFKATVGQMGGI